MSAPRRRVSAQLSLAAVLPLLGIQVQTLSDTIALLSGSHYSGAVTLLLCAAIAACAVRFGAATATASATIRC